MKNSKHNNKSKESSSDSEINDIPDTDKFIVKVPKNLYINSELDLSNENIKEKAAYIRRSQNFHHLWKSDDELVDLKKIIKLQ